MKQGDIHWVELPPPAGREQAGRRPAIIMQSEQFTNRLPTVLVVPLTSRLATLRFPATVLIQPDAQNGLSVPSVALVFQMRVVDKRAVKERIGTLNPAVFARVLQELDRLLGR
jgi:mRNA interferase MazF